MKSAMLSLFRTRRVVCLLGWWLVCTQVNALIIPIPGDVITKRAINAAEVICVGAVSETIRVVKGQAPLPSGKIIDGQWEQVRFAVDRMIKGAQVEQVVIECFTPTGEEAAHGSYYFSAVPEDSRVIVFLVKGPRNKDRYRLLHNLGPVVRVAEKVNSKPATHATLTEALQFELAATLSLTEQAVLIPAIRSLARLGNLPPATLQALAGLSNHDNLAITTEALSARIRTGDLEALIDAKECVVSGRCLPEIEDVTGVLSAAISLVRTPKAIPGLESLLLCEDAHIRRGASEALRHIQDPKVCKILLSALTDEDLTVQYNALMGLAQPTAESPQWASWAVSFKSFSENPDYYRQQCRASQKAHCLN